MSKTKLTILIVIYFFNILASTAATSTVNEEAQALQLCLKYTLDIKQLAPLEKPIDCKQVHYSKNEWECLYDRRIVQGWSARDAINRCIKVAPALALLIQKQVTIQNMSPNTICISAFSSFIKFFPREKLLIPLSRDCAKTKLSALKWYCMDEFAKEGNSYNFAAHQCFP